MKVDWQKIPESGLPEGCPHECWIYHEQDERILFDDDCGPRYYANRSSLYYADATGHIPDPPEPEPENPPKPDFVQDGFVLTGECRVSESGEWYADAYCAGRMHRDIGYVTWDSDKYAGRRWILRKLDAAERDREDVPAALSKIKDVVETAIRELT